MIGESGDLKPFVSLPVFRVVMQGAAVAEGLGTPIGKVARVEACDGIAEMSTHY